MSINPFPHLVVGNQNMAMDAALKMWISLIGRVKANATTANIAMHQVFGPCIWTNAQHSSPKMVRIKTAGVPRTGSRRLSVKNAVIPSSVNAQPAGASESRQMSRFAKIIPASAQKESLQC